LVADEGVQSDAGLFLTDRQGRCGLRHRRVAGRDVADDGLAAWMDVNVLDADRSLGMVDAVEKSYPPFGETIGSRTFSNKRDVAK